MLESYALPGQLIRSDSHTPHSGAIGCVAFGIGTTDVFNSWITKCASAGAGVGEDRHSRQETSEIYGEGFDPKNS